MRRSNIVFVWTVACALCVSAQISFPRSQRFPQMSRFTVSATARFEPASPVVGEPCAIILELDVDNEATLDKIQVHGLPEAKDGFIVYGELENLAGGKFATSGRVVKRVRLPMRFQKPFSRQVSPTVEGMVRTVQDNMSCSQNFVQRLAPLRLEARALPEAGRPADFSGAVGPRFEMKQMLNCGLVQPNDLITATYTLDFDGYCPPGITPNVEWLSRDFKAYKIKEKERTDHRVTWTQILIPRTAQATNTALVSFNYYNPHTKRYEVARAEPHELTFESTDAADSASSSAEASLEIVASSTNLVVTEQVQVSLVLRLPPVPGDYADTHPPVFNQRPPHFTCPFLETEEWKSGVVGCRDALIPLSSDQMSRPGIRTPAFTLNNYVTYDISAMMDDPFDQFNDMDLFNRRLGPKRLRFPFTVAREADKGWRLTIALAPWRTMVPGTVRIDPVTVEVPLITGVKRVRDRFNRPALAPQFKNVVLRTKPLTFTVDEPPAAGRPASWCGAIASNLTVSAVLSTNVWTAGNPLTLMLEITGAANPSSVHPPDFTSSLADSVFRIDADSLKTEKQGESLRFTWCVRSVKTGTVEFPSLPVSYYDFGLHAYVTRMTESFPVQVKPGLLVVHQGMEVPHAQD